MMTGTTKLDDKPASRNSVVSLAVSGGVEVGGISNVAIVISIVGVLLLILGAGPPI